jgi:hypothetical protein
MIRPLALIVALTAAFPASAQVFRAENRVDVSPVAGGFLVSNDAAEGARGMWCAAADYASRALGASEEQRLFIAQGRSGNYFQRTPVLFTLDPAGVEPRPVTIVSASLWRPGSTLTIGHARQFCADNRLSSR